MNQEQVIELAKKVGFQIENPDDPADKLWHECAIEGYARFAALVEQATLERAAKECETISDCYWSGDGAAAASSCAGNIRSLAKEPQ